MIPYPKYSHIISNLSAAAYNFSLNGFVSFDASINSYFLLKNIYVSEGQSKHALSLYNFNIYLLHMNALFMIRMTTKKMIRR